MKTVQEMNAAIAAHWKTQLVGQYEVMSPCRCAQCKRYRLAIDRAMHGANDDRAITLQAKSQRAVAAQGWAV